MTDTFTVSASELGTKIENSSFSPQTCRIYNSMDAEGGLLVDEEASAGGFVPALSLTMLDDQTTTSPISDFNESECGEPLIPQRIFLDFTPNPDLDTPEIKEKVSHFWNFIMAQKEFQHLCVNPDPLYDEEKTGSDLDPDDEPEPEAPCSISTTTETFIPDALTMLDKFGRSTGYGPEDANKVSPRTASKKKAQLQSMCKTLDDWDREHPKSMDPPKHPPYQRPVLQRVIPPEQNIETCPCMK